MSVTNRQNRLLLAEDWKRVYQTFRNADFRSYDFDGLRRTMIAYIRDNYPEDFNDYIESSEYLALIDLIAFLGQNISYRIDLNSRENFLELAERRESVLRLARLLSYNPKRNQCANGLIKFEAVSTTEEVVDSNGTNLSNQTVVWNDNTLIGREEWLLPLINASLEVVSLENKKDLGYVIIKNHSDVKFVLRNISKFNFFMDSDLVEVPAHGEAEIVVITRGKKNRFDLEFEVQNAIFAPRKHPVIKIEVK